MLTLQQKKDLVSFALDVMLGRPFPPQATTDAFGALMLYTRPNWNGR